MKNNFILIVLILKVFFSSIIWSVGAEPFNFDVTEIEITENGNKFINIHNNPIGKANAYNHFKLFYKLKSENIFFIGSFYISYTIVIL